MQKKKKSRILENKGKETRGITLLALVVTIIVLLILAGVAISLTVGNNGIFKRAKNTVETWNKASEDETSEMQNFIYLYDEIEYGVDSAVSDEIKEDLTTNYETYLEQAREKGQTTETNIGIGTDGNVVNLDLWHYYKTDDGRGMSLGKGEVCEGHRGYDEEDLIDGEIQGFMPQYIYNKTENKVYPVTKLSNTFCSYYDEPSQLKKMPTIPSTVRSIENSAFMNCSRLTSVTIPDSVTSIGGLAFEGCIALESITIPSSVNNIGERAFNGCSALKNVYFKQTVAPSFGDNCFYTYAGETTTFYFKNLDVYNALTTRHYNSLNGTKSTNFSW